MKEGEVVYIMYNGVNSSTLDTLLFSGKGCGKEEHNEEDELTPVDKRYRLNKHI